MAWKQQSLKQKNAIKHTNMNILSLPLSLCSQKQMRQNSRILRPVPDNLPTTSLLNFVGVWEGWGSKAMGVWEGWGVKGHGCVSGLRVEGHGCGGGLRVSNHDISQLRAHLLLHMLALLCLSVVGGWFG